MTRYFNDTCNVLSNVGVSEFPFPFGDTKQCLPPDLYARLAASRPTFPNPTSDNNRRYDINAVQLLQSNIPCIWRDFVEYHTSQSFYFQILHRFEKCFIEFYPFLKDMRFYKVGRRFDGSDSDIFLECQLSINTPVKEKSTVAPPHVDNPISLWASLLYMTEEGDSAGGDFVIHKCVDAPIFNNSNTRQCQPHRVRPYGVIPYTANSYVCLLNSPVSVHSVTDREVTDKQRLMVNITLEFGREALFHLITENKQ